MFNSCAWTLISVYVFILFVQFSNVHGKRRSTAIGECEAGEIDRVSAKDRANIILEFLSNLICCTCGIVDSRMQTEYAKCKCSGEQNNDEVEVTDKTGVEAPQIDGYTHTECFVNRSIASEEFTTECFKDGRSSCSKKLENLAAEIAASFCVDI